LVGGPLELADFDVASASVRTAAEVALAVLLFTDAARLNVHRLRADEAMASRLLLIGFPLSVVAGYIAARLIYPGTGVWICAVLAAAVAPTDAALAAPVVSDERLAGSIRRILNVESGLNDGLATPLVNFFVVGAVAAGRGSSSWEGGALRELAYGGLVGVAVGLVGAFLLGLSTRRRWSTVTLRPLMLVALALLAFGAAHEFGGNGFVAAFVAGLAFAMVFGTSADELFEFADLTGTGLSVVVWFLFGATFLPLLTDASWRDVVFALVVLTAGRMVPVAVALLGTGTDAKTVALIGWFGPRGLASIVFAVIAIGPLGESAAMPIVIAVTVTVLFSVVAHGVSAAPLVGAYVRSKRRGT
jgi:NhaP-type Na+/H+ or K+/H+ antiporter